MTTPCGASMAMAASSGGPRGMWASTAGGSDAWKGEVDLSEQMCIYDMVILNT